MVAAMSGSTIVSLSPMIALGAPAPPQSWRRWLRTPTGDLLFYGLSASSVEAF
jgi:hypothetical protein